MARRQPKALKTMGEPEAPESLLHIFSQIEDPRVQRTRAYSWIEVLFLVIAATISGVSHVTHMQDFGEAKLEWLRTILPYENGIPSHDTIGRVLGILNPDELENAFLQWMKSVRSHVEGVVAIDGKTLRNAIAPGQSRSFVHMVSAFSAANGVVLGQLKVDEKSNEITAIPELLRRLELNGAIVTIDAIGCQVSILREIVEREGHFVVSVKKNQPTLFHSIGDAFFNLEDRLSGEETGYTKCRKKARGHGREETRQAEVLEAPESIRSSEIGDHVQSIVRVTRERTTNSDGESEKSTSYYVSSVAGLDPEEVLQYIRDHWKIENQLHWQLDVTFGEDRCRAYAENAAENLVVIRHVALNLLREAKSMKGGMQSRRNQAAWSDQVRERLILGE